MIGLKTSFATIVTLFGLNNTTPIIGYQNIVETATNVQFKIPEKDVQRKEENGLVAYFSKTTDDLVASQAFVFGNYTLVGNTDLSTYMAQSGEADTLNAIAKFMLVNSEGAELIYMQKPFNTPTKKVMDIGIKSVLQIEGGTTTFIHYTRYRLEGKRMVILSSSAQEAYLNALITVRNQTWGSLQLN